MTDAVIIEAVRTPIGALGGSLAAIRPDDLAAHVLKVAGGTHRAGSGFGRGSLPWLREWGG